MASYRFNATIVKRKGGRSVVAAASYRSGEKLRDDLYETVHDYSRKKGIGETFVLIPEGADERFLDREYLWNYVEAMELRKDAQLAREIVLSLPYELTHEQRVKLVKDFVYHQFIKEGMVADISLHNPVRNNGDDPRNYHAHILLTLRQAHEAGLSPVKTRQWNSAEALRGWRTSWAEFQNRALERYGHQSRVDHRTLKAQREDALERGDYALADHLDRAPEIHVGPKAGQMQRRGYVPQSKDKEKVVYSKDRTNRTSRSLFYTRLDKSDRTSHNLSIITANNLRQRDKKRQIEAKRSIIVQNKNRAFDSAKEARTTMLPLIEGLSIHTRQTLYDQLKKGHGTPELDIFYQLTLKEIDERLQHFNALYDRLEDRANTYSDKLLPIHTKDRYSQISGRDEFH